MYYITLRDNIYCRIKILVFTLTLFIGIRSAVSQEMPGLTNSNFAGSNAVLINPANMVLSKIYFDVHLFTAGAFVQNNLVYIPANDYKIMDFLNSSKDLPTYPPNNNNFTYYKNALDKYAFNSERIIGPSAMMLYGDHAFSFQTSVRTALSATNIPYEIGVFSIEGLRYPPFYNVNFWSKNERVGAMAWGEVSFSYAYAFKKEFRDHWSAGISVKRLMGYSAGFMRVKELNYVVLNDSTLNIRNLTADAGFSLPVDFDNNDFPIHDPFFKGGGFGFDLGVTFTRMKQGFQRNNPRYICEQPYSDYKYRVGVSLLDIGAINFKHNAQLHQFVDGNAFWQNFDTTNYSNINQLARQFSEVLLGDPDASLKGSKFRMGLPSAISLQFDYHYRQNIYINATIIQPLVIWKYGVVRPAQLAVTPRFETDWFEFSLPFSLYQYRLPRLGAAVRLGVVSLGTDRLGTLLGMTDLTGVDIYASVKFNLRKGRCLRSKGTSYCENEEYGFTNKLLRAFKKRVR